MSDQLYQRQRQQLLHHPLFSWPGLGVWSFYFLLKIGAGLFGYIDLNILWNLVLVAFLVVPVQPRFVKPLRQIIAIAAAVILIYQETSLPPFSRLIDQWQLVSSFSGWYLLELVGRFISIEAIAVFLVALILFMYARKILRMTAISLALLVAYPLLPNFSADTLQPEATAQARGAPSITMNQRADGANDPDSVLDRFYAQQQQIRLSPPSNAEPNFDILILNICSLSWQDLEQFELLEHPLWETADIMLSNFYTGSSYSGPATLRLLQASCGHAPHSQLFEPEAACTINDQLSSLGFESEIRMNHSGAFDNYLSLIRELGGMSDANFVEPEQFPISMTGFDQSPIRADSAVLSDWLNSLGDTRKFTFYNTTSLHDGNRLPGFRGNSIASYRARVNTLLDDTLQMFRDIEASGRNVLVIMVPEHGAGLQGDRFQLPGMREIPTPALTHVPVLFKLFGEGINGANNELVQVGQLTGPSAISEVIFEVMRQQPFSGGRYLPEDIGHGITETLPVLENDRVIMLNVEGQFFLQINNGEWRPYNR